MDWIHDRSGELLLMIVAVIASSCGDRGSDPARNRVAHAQAALKSPSGVMSVFAARNPLFDEPTGVAVDGSGNIYVADQMNNAVRKITAGGIVTTLAGGSWGNADGTGAAAQFYNPAGVAVDGSGNVYVADVGNNAIRKITPSGVVTTLAGGSWGSVDGTGTAAQFSYPMALAVDASGNVFVADTGNFTIRKITPDAEVTTFAGTAGVYGSADGTGTAAQFNGPDGAAVDGSGNVYVFDRGNATIRKITPDAVVTTFAGRAGVFGSADGTGATAQFSGYGGPHGVAVDVWGNVFVADSGNATIRMITPDAMVTTLAGPGGQGGVAPVDGTGAAAIFENPTGVAVDGSGNVYVTDQGGATIRKITSAAVVTTFAGTEWLWGYADGPVSASHNVALPYGVAVGSSGNVYVTDWGTDIVLMITPADEVSTLAGMTGTWWSADGSGGAAQFCEPSGIALDGAGNAYIADLCNNTVRKITQYGMVTTIAGTPGVWGSADGTGPAARFAQPAGVALDGSGNVYVADGGSTIRKITPAGVVTTIAGTAFVGGSADGTGAAARFTRPQGVAAVGAAGTLYVADTGNCTIRQITPRGAVTTFAGTAGVCGSADGTGAAAQFNMPRSLTVDGSGNIYVADTGNNTIRKITPNAVVSTVVGVSGQATTIPGALPASIAAPYGVAADPSTGNIYVATEDGVLKVIF